MATNRNLRAAESTLSSSRQQFIQTLEQKRQFEADCAVIIPELDRLWKEKILDPFQQSVEETTVVNWKHFLFNYRPQLLSQAITRLASRLRLSTDWGGVLPLIVPRLVNARGPVENLSAYYKSIVQDLRKKEVRGEKKRADIIGDPSKAQPGTEDIVKTITGRSSTIPGLETPECQQCLDEEGSLACIRLAHKVFDGSTAAEQPSRPEPNPVIHCRRT
jgi:hypothetical protein